MLISAVLAAPVVPGELVLLALRCNRTSVGLQEGEHLTRLPAKFLGGE